MYLQNLASCVEKENKESTRTSLVSDAISSHLLWSCCHTEEQHQWTLRLPLTARWALPLCCLRVGAAASLEPWPAAGCGLFTAALFWLLCCSLELLYFTKPLGLVYLGESCLCCGISATSLLLAKLVSGIHPRSCSLVLVSARIELIFLLATGRVVCLGFKIRIMWITH